MAEVITVIGLAVSIIQLIDASTKLYERLKEFKEGTFFGNVTKQVDLLRETMRRLQKAQTDGHIHTASERAVSEVVDGCKTLITDLDRVISRMTPADGSSRRQRVFKSIQSFGKDRRIKEILAKLDRYSAQLATFFAVDASISSRGTVSSNFNANPPPVQSTDTATFFEVPGLQVSHFVGREDLLSKIDTSFRGSAGTFHVPVTVLLGMGGQGKTQIALEYCNRSRAAYRGLFWIDASSKSTASRSIKNIAIKLGASETATSPDSQVDFVKSVLGGWTKSWMLVFDNYDDHTSFKDIKTYFPTGCGRILCTSRHADVGRLGTTLDVGSLSETEGLDLLLYRSHQERTNDNVKEGTTIVRKLGCLALAIDQAAAYITFRQLPLMHFLDHYERRKKMILNHTPDSVWEYRRTLGDAEDQTSLSTFTTWEMSFQQIAQDESEQRNIGHFLTLAAFLNPAKISEDLFQVYFAKARRKPEWMQGFCTQGDWDSDIYQDTVCGLFNLSLIQSMEYTGTQTTFSLHPLIRDWLQLRRDPEDHQRCSTEVLQLLAAYVDIVHRPDFLTHSVRMEASSHIRFWLESDEVVPQSHSAEPPEGWRGEFPVIPYNISVLVCFFWWIIEPELELGEKLALRNLDGCAKYLGQTNLGRMYSARNLGAVYEAQGRYVDAKAMYEEALEMAKGSDDRINILGNLADLSGKQKDHNTAAQRWISIFKTRLSSVDDTSKATIKAAYYAGMSYLKTQDFVTAAILIEAAAWALGHSSLGLLAGWDCHASLGEYYMSRDKLVESKKWLTLGARVDHSNPYNLGFLGQLFIKTRSYDEAEDYLQQAKKSYERFYGPLFLGTLITARMQGLFYWGIGKLEAAVACLEEAAEGYRQSRGPSDDMTVHCAHLLSELRTVISCGNGTGDLPYAVRVEFELEDLSSSIIDQPGWDPLQYEYTPLQIELLEWAGRVLNRQASTGEGVGAESVNGESGVAEAMGELRISNSIGDPQGLDAAETSNGRQPPDSGTLSPYLVTAYRLLPPVPRMSSETKTNGEMTKMKRKLKRMIP